MLDFLIKIKDSKTVLLQKIKNYIYWRGYNQRYMDLFFNSIQIKKKKLKESRPSYVKMEESKAKEYLEVLSNFHTFNANKPNMYCFWTGLNKMSTNRENSFKTMSVSGFNIILIHKFNLDNYIKEPLHPAFEYLSDTHKADYLRCYFMHFYGGAYSDIKPINQSLVKYYDELMVYQNKYCSGYPEPELYELFRLKPNKVLGPCTLMFKKNTEITIEWYKEINYLLDKKFNLLVKYPAKHPQQKPELLYPYPIEWIEMLALILHKIIAKNNDKCLFNLPLPISENYM